MKRLAVIVAIMGLWITPAFSQGPRNLAGRGDVVAPTPAQQIQKRIVALYISHFREKVELTDEQFLKVEPIASQFIQARFRAANQRSGFKQRRDQLLSQSNPSQVDIQQLNDDESKFETEFAGIDSRITRKLQPELSGRQLLLISDFNRQFFTEQLPRLLERAREELATQRRPGAAPGENQKRRDANQPANTLRGNNKVQPNPARKQ